MEVLRLRWSSFTALYSVHARSIVPESLWAKAPFSYVTPITSGEAPMSDATVVLPLTTSVETGVLAPTTVPQQNDRMGSQIVPPGNDDGGGMTSSSPSGVLAGNTPQVGVENNSPNEGREELTSGELFQPKPKRRRLGVHRG